MKLLSVFKNDSMPVSQFNRLRLHVV